MGGLLLNILGGMVCAPDSLELDPFSHLTSVFNLNRGKIVEKISVRRSSSDVSKWVLSRIGLMAGCYVVDFW